MLPAIKQDCANKIESNSASVLSHTLDSQLGTRCLRTFMLRQTVVFSRQLKIHYFSLAFNVF